MRHKIEKSRKNISLRGVVMEELMDILPIAVIICFAVFTILVLLIAIGIKVKGNEYAPKTVDELYGAWNNQSKVVRLSVAARLIFIGGNLAIACYFAFGLLMGVEPTEFFRKMIDYENAGDEEIFQFLRKLTVDYFFGYVAILAGSWLIIALLGMLQTFSLSRWIKQKNIDCYPLIKKKEGNINIKQVSKSYLVAAQPSSSIVFYVDYAIKIVLSAAGLWSVRRFLTGALASARESFFFGGPEPEMGEWLKKMLITNEAIAIYVIIGVAIVLSIVIRTIINKKQTALLDAVEASRKEDII